MPTNLRTASESDAAEIAILVNRAYRPAPHERRWTHEADLISGPRTSTAQVLSLFRAESCILVLSAGPKIAACIHLLNEKSSVYIGMLATDPALQAQGLGKQMPIKRFTLNTFSRILKMTKQRLKIMMAVGLLAASLSNGAQADERRCGWLENPSPSNWYLTDADTSWILMEQNEQEPNLSIELPSFREEKGWFVKTGGSSGYGCACLSVTVNKKTERVLTASKGKMLPIKTCKNDKKLPQQEQ